MKRIKTIDYVGKHLGYALWKREDGSLYIRVPITKCEFCPFESLFKLASYDKEKKKFYLYSIVDEKPICGMIDGKEKEKVIIDVKIVYNGPKEETSVYYLDNDVVSNEKR